MGRMSLISLLSEIWITDSLVKMGISLVIMDIHPWYEVATKQGPWGSTRPWDSEVHW